ncbi:MAG: transcription termination/antitermination protein NusG [Paracoccaceae bacterium]
MSVHDDGSTWFLAQLKPNSAKIAERNLRRQNFQTFLPVEEVTKRGKSTFVTAEKPVFPGYIFVAFDVAKGGWQAINATQGITRLVCFGAAPAPVPQDIVAGLMQRCGGQSKLISSAPVSPGDQVVLPCGPFTDFVATVDKIEPDRRVWVLLDIMGIKTRVAVPPDHVRAI